MAHKSWVDSDHSANIRFMNKMSGNCYRLLETLVQLILNI